MKRRQTIARQKQLIKAFNKLFVSNPDKGYTELYNMIAEEHKCSLSTVIRHLKDHVREIRDRERDIVN